MTVTSSRSRRAVSVATAAILSVALAFITAFGAVFPARSLAAPESESAASGSSSASSDGSAGSSDSLSLSDAVNHEQEFTQAHSTDHEQETVLLGFYPGDTRFLNGFADDERKTGYGYEFLQDIAAHNNWRYEYVYGSYGEMLDMLAAGDIDMVPGVQKTPENENRFLFSELDMGVPDEEFYVALNLNDGVLLDELDEAQAHIMETDPGFMTDLADKYYVENDTPIEFTEHQSEWLASHKTLTFGFVSSSLPISGADENGYPLGVAALVIDELQTNLDAEIQPIAYDSLPDLLTDIRDNKIDMAFPIFTDPWNAEQNNSVLTGSIITDRAMIVYSGDYRDNLTEKVGAYRNGPNQTVFVSTNYPDAELVMYNTRDEALQGVLDGEVNCVIGCSSVLQRFLNENIAKYEGLNTAILPDSEEFSVAVNRSNGILSTIVDTVTSHIDEQDVTTALIQNSSNSQAYSLGTFLRHNAVSLIIGLIVFAALIIAAGVWYLRRLRRFNREQAESHVMLEEALTAANSANAAKTTFLSSMSHDIRTPMNGIIGMTTIARVNIDDKEKVEDCLDKISVSSHHLLNLINDILDMSKIEAGDMTLNEEVFDLATLMSDLLTLNKPLADAKGHELVTRVIGVEHEKVIGDPLRVSQLLTNLLSNSIKYTPAGGRIEISVEEVPIADPKQACYKFIVADNGVGMSKEYLPKLFEPFTRETERSSRGGEQGTGLGMAIVRNIIGLMGGDIEVESELGEGTTFTVTLFLRPYDEDAIKYDHMKGWRVLVVDDDESVCESVCLLLDEMGLVGEWVTSGEEAVARVDREKGPHEYQAVLVDWKMPGMDGLATTRAIREHVGDEVPLIIISAYDWSDIAADARAAGANGFIGKPLFRSRLVLLFDSLLEEEEDAHLAGSSIDAKAKAANLEGKRALLVEDNELNGQIALEILGMSGMEFDWAKNGQESVDMFVSSPEGYYSCILMDIQMPVMGGLEASRLIRSLDRADAATVPIFAMTADAFNEDKTAALEAGMNEHLAKPLDFDLVFDVLNRYLNK